MTKYTLTNCIEKNREHPQTWEIPNHDDISSLKEGDFVKLIFDNKERMWVKITSVDGIVFEGLLNNEPLDMSNLALDDLINFESKHIASIMKK